MNKSAAADQGRWMPPPRPLGGVSTTGALPSRHIYASSAPSATPPLSTPEASTPAPTAAPSQAYEQLFAFPEAASTAKSTSTGTISGNEARPLEPPWMADQESSFRIGWGVGSSLLIGLLLITVIGVLFKFGGLQGALLSLTGNSLLSGKVNWEHNIPTASHQVADQVALGSWVADGVVVFADRHRLIALDQQSGESRWQINPPATNTSSSNYFCGMSTITQRDVGVVAFGPEISGPNGSPQIKCNGLTLVDLHSGHLRWVVANTLQDPNAAPATAHPELAGQTAVVSVDGNLASFDVNSGNQIWFHPKAAPELKNGSCQAVDILPKPTGSVALYGCGDQGDAILQLDLQGNQLANIDLPSQVVPGSVAGGTTLISADPIVVAVPESSDNSGDGKYLVLASGGNLISLPEQGDWGSLDLHASSPSGAAHRTYHTVVSRDILITATTATPVTSIRDTNKLVAFDLSSGKERWAKSLGGTITGVPVSIEGNSVLSLGTGTYDNPPQAFQMSIPNGDTNPLGGAYPRDLIYKPNISKLHWVNHQIYGVTLDALSGSFSIYSLG